MVWLLCSYAVCQTYDYPPQHVLRPRQEHVQDHGQGVQVQPLPWYVYAARQLPSNFVFGFVIVLSFMWPGVAKSVFILFSACSSCHLNIMLLSWSAELLRRRHDMS